MSLAFDFLALPECKGSDGVVYDAAFVVVDRLSGYIQAIPCRKKGLTSEKLAQLFIRHCVLFMGLPLEVLSDNDVLVTTDFFRSLCEQLGIVQYTSVIYRPTGNGRAERAVRTIVNILRVTLSSKGLREKWVDILPWCLFVQNGLPGVVTWFSPHNVVFGRDLMLPGELPPLSDHLRPRCPDEFFESLRDTRLRVKRIMGKTHGNRSRKYANEHRNMQYFPGDKVWVRILPRDTVDKRRQKLRPLWFGPCEILRNVANGRYRVQTSSGPEDLHIDMFKPYHPRLNGVAIPFHYFQPDPDMDDAPESYVVEKVLDYRKKGDRQEWLVKWRGYDKPTWQPAEDFISGMQDEWHEFNVRNKISVNLAALPLCR